jgi:dTDP-4-dehydrorhamnose 3,5-epimerase
MGNTSDDGDLYVNHTLTTHQTAIPGVLLFDLVVTQDGRGWSKTSYEHGPMTSAGIPATFKPTRWCANHNRWAGVTRGVHAELTNKYVSISRGTIWVAIVDLRFGETFGLVATMTLTAGRGLYIPIGCGNSYQTQTADVAYSYIADDNVGSPERRYVGVNLADPDLAIPWPIPLTKSRILPADRTQPWLREVHPLKL